MIAIHIFSATRTYGYPWYRAHMRPDLGILTSNDVPVLVRMAALRIYHFGEALQGAQRLFELVVIAAPPFVLLGFFDQGVVLGLCVVEVADVALGDHYDMSAPTPADMDPEYALGLTVP